MSTSTSTSTIVRKTKEEIQLEKLNALRTNKATWSKCQLSRYYYDCVYVYTNIHMRQSRTMAEFRSAQDMYDQLCKIVWNVEPGGNALKTITYVYETTDGNPGGAYRKVVTTCQDPRPILKERTPSEQTHLMNIVAITETEHLDALLKFANLNT